MATNGVDGPLKGIKVLDWTMWQMGPVSTAMMGDMGADVIKIEALDGDAGRAVRRAITLDTGLVADRNGYFESGNRNKRGIAVDLTTGEGVEIVQKLVEKTDVFVQNFRQGVAERLGLGYDTLREINPMLVYGSASGYGPNGPDSNLPSFDGCGQARSGLMMSATPAGALEPNRVTQGASDQMGAIMLAYGIMTALLARERHGMGQEVNASHLGSMTYLQGLSVSMKTMAGIAMPRSFRHKAYNPLWNHYRCKDDLWIALAMLQPDRYWSDFARIIGRPELAEDPRFDIMAHRSANAEDCIALLDEIFATRPRAEWIQRIKDDGADLIYTIVNSVADLPEDPQVKANGYIAEVDHPQHGPTDMVGVPVALSETPGNIRRVAPELGEHTEEILTDVLGWDWDKVGELREKKVI